MLVRPLTGVKDAGKVRNRRVAKSQIALLLVLIVAKMFVPRQLIHGCRYCFTNNINELHLLLSIALWVKKRRQWLEYWHLAL